MSFRTFRVVESEETRIDVDDDLLGWGVQFPDSGDCYVEWFRGAFPEEDRLEEPHVSKYGCLEDVEQGTGGAVVDVAEVEQ